MKMVKTIKKFGSYIIVGGLATIVEWVMFYLFSLFGIQYLLATVFAIIISTFSNWFFGRLMTFKKAEKQSFEIIKIYLVSIVGLLFNLLLMWILHGNFGIGSMVSKMIATVVVFIYNYLIRVKLVYRK